MPEYSTELRAEVDAAMAKATKAFPVTSHETPDYAEITFGSSHTQAMSMEPDTLLALNGMFEAVPLLTAHIDAQAKRIAELERVLREINVAARVSEALSDDGDGEPWKMIADKSAAALKDTAQ